MPSEDPFYTASWPTLDELMPDRREPFARRFVKAVRSHPAPLYGYLESAFWLVVFVSIADHLSAPNGTTGTLTWYLTIGVHEIGHVVCMPFGQLVMFLGGSVWQVLFWALLAVYVYAAHRRISGALVFATVVGHSLINAARYIADARARQMPLLFGLGADHHDWWNILSRLGLLEYDQLLAGVTTALGVLVLLGVVFLGIITAWMLPRTQLGSIDRRPRRR